MEVATLGIGAAGALLKATVGELFSYVKGKVGEPQKVVKKALTNTDLGKAAYAVISVKTLWNVEKEVSLFEFYYPSRVKLPEEKNAREIASFSSFPSGRNYVLQGTAGQGKSILLRYLYGKQIFGLATDSRIPVFVELRRITPAKSLNSLIVDELKRLGLPSEEAYLPVYFSSGKVLLLLDGFDEVHPDQIQATVHDVECLAQTYPELTIVTTARPDSAIQKSPHFRVARIDPLKSSDHLPFLEKICRDRAQALSIHTAIRSNAQDLGAMLTTPLLLTLLVLLYRAQSTIPTTLARFYEQLFDVLFFRHDQTKPGFQRVRHTNLDESQLKRVFEAFSFQSQITNKLVFTDSELSDCVSEAARLAGISVSPAGFKKDLVKTACLLVEDGPETSFIHKSVAEFYASTFVQRSNSEFAQEFYSQISEQFLHHAWAGELTFLREIDSYRFAKFYLIPEARQLLSLVSGMDLLDSLMKEDKWVNAWLNETVIHLAKQSDGSFEFRGISPPSSFTYRGHYSTPVFVAAVSPMVSVTLNEKNRSKLNTAFDPIPSNGLAAVKPRILDDVVQGRLAAKMRESLDALLGKLKSDLLAQEKLVEREEAKMKLVPQLGKKKA